MTKSLCDKLALHTLIVALSTSGYAIRTASLSVDMEMPSATVANLLRQVGCKVVPEKSADGADGHVATLPAPLVFPPRRRKRG